MSAPIAGFAEGRGRDLQWGRGSADSWVAPKRGIAIPAVCNQDGDVAFKACDAVVQALLALNEKMDVASAADGRGDR